MPECLLPEKPKSRAAGGAATPLRQVGHVEAALRQFRVGGVTGIPELRIRAQLVELGQRDDRIHVVRRLVPEFVRGESQGERGTPVERQLHRVIQVPVQRLQDGERIIHGA
jgi:hypothetical protein